eukprot:4448007-Prymnesium_polylepis.2
MLTWQEAAELDHLLPGDDRWAPTTFSPPLHPNPASTRGSAGAGQVSTRSSPRPCPAIPGLWRPRGEQAAWRAPSAQGPPC